MEFTPRNEDGPAMDVPYMDEARAADGWQGQGTTLSYERLKSQIADAISRLGGVVHRFQRGDYVMEGGLTRAGLQIHYSLEGPGGAMVYGRLDVAALPTKRPKQRDRGGSIFRGRQEKALTMAMYNMAAVLRAQWVLKQLNPGYVPLLPWLLDKKGRTLTQSYADAGMSPALMPPKGDWIEGEVREMGR